MPKQTNRRLLILNIRLLAAPLAAALCAGCFPMAGAASSAPAALPNFHTVAPGIYRSGVPSVDGLKQLKAMGVKTIIDLRISPRRVKQEGVEARAMGFRWMNLPMGGDPPTPREVKTLLATLNDKSAQPVLVHCEHGADRTGCMIGIYREQVQKWGYPETYAEMRKYGFNPHWTKLSGTVQKFAEGNRQAAAR